MVGLGQLFAVTLLLGLSVAGKQRQAGKLKKETRCFNTNVNTDNWTNINFKNEMEGKPLRTECQKRCFNSEWNYAAAANQQCWCSMTRFGGRARIKECTKKEISANSQCRKICFYQRDPLIDKPKTEPSPPGTNGKNKNNSSSSPSQGPDRNQSSPRSTQTSASSTSTTVSALPSSVPLSKSAIARQQNSKSASPATKDENNTITVIAATATATNSSNQTIDSTTVDMNFSMTSNVNQSESWNITSTMSISSTAVVNSNTTNIANSNSASADTANEPQPLLAAYIGGGAGALVVCAAVVTAVVVHRRRAKRPTDSQERSPFQQHSNPSYDRTSEVIGEVKVTSDADVSDYTYVTMAEKGSYSQIEDYAYVTARGDIGNLVRDDNSTSKVYSSASDLVYSLAEPFDEERHEDEVVLEENELYGT